MTKRDIYIGKSKTYFHADEIKGSYVTINNESYYKLSNCNLMRPFFMSIVSNANHWMFISSNGGLTAGRKNSEQALFPYYTDDKITESINVSGSKAILIITLNGKNFLWEPFSKNASGIYKTKRNLYKNTYGNKIIFEEVNEDLGVTYQYEWNSSDQFGFVKKAKLKNTNPETIEVSMVDGIQNILPSGITSALQNTRSNLVDAYKKNELEANVGLGIYTLSAVIVDKAEPSESLKANTVWSIGLNNTSYLISSLQLAAFRKGYAITQETDIRAEKGAYFIHSSFSLPPNSDEQWAIIANVNQGPEKLANLLSELENKDVVYKKVLEDIELGTTNLIKLTAAADGLQLSSDRLKNTRHFANVMFNIMRGGIFDQNYSIEKSDFLNYLNNANKKVYSKTQALVSELDKQFSLAALRQLASRNDDTDFQRLCYEYMPLKFSRRHGDPSRPWNKFSINTTNETDGSKVLDYEGNWRDIFQNWEALAHSYPAFIESMIHKFLNATTFEGYNPYRVTKDGFDWEVIEPEDPWSFIGYWGDHQIIYLLKLLEFAEKHFPASLAAYFTKDIFVYANVPYKIKSYQDTLNDPKNTIDFDVKLDRDINTQKKSLGSDGALLTDHKGAIYKVNLIEKLLAPLLVKISNFIPEAGIWLNTQRPEWNDANNALVGNGVSMVTLYYIKRFLNFFEQITKEIPKEGVGISKELSVFFKAIVSTFSQYEHLLSGKISDVDRKTILDGLGIPASEYRTGIYQKGFSNEKSTVTKSEILNFIGLAKRFLDHTIAANKRTDNLYHSYNLMTLENYKAISIGYLPVMLEGQVAVLNAETLSAKQVLTLLDGLKKSELYREDQASYLLYPNKELPRFIHKNIIPKEAVQKSALLSQLTKDQNKQIIVKDISGVHHFNGNFNNAHNLTNALKKLPATYDKLIAKEEQLLLDIYENVFNHKEFTGRSGTFFGYEGLGSIYWHMVSKLVLAIQENCLSAVSQKEDIAILSSLNAHFHEANEGVGVHKTPQNYGAIPTDPYSHTPAGKGAQQPGMTGQVKEDILSRFGELGVIVKQGQVGFNPSLLKADEFLKAPTTFKYFSVNEEEVEIQLDLNSLCFTYCQVPIIYRIGKDHKIEVVNANKTSIKLNQQYLDKEISKALFERSGKIDRIIVTLPDTTLQ
jgi:hypothetical protein